MNICEKAGHKYAAGLSIKKIIENLKNRLMSRLKTYG